MRKLDHADCECLAVPPVVSSVDIGGEARSVYYRAHNRISLKRNTHIPDFNTYSGESHQTKSPPTIVGVCLWFNGSLNCRVIALCSNV